MHLPTLPSLLLLLPPFLSLPSHAQEVASITLHSAPCTRPTAKGDKISVHYRGSLQATGKEFDASYNRGQPLSFTLGGGMVIKGWDQGLLDMCIGDRRELTIPPELGYGERGMGPIPGGSTLVFETELMGIEGVERDEL